jgi:DNA polymerase V|tara:strand:- start:67 stop:492 length:426 start_codon:yes stop_codon:yes gene_type:complete
MNLYPQQILKALAPARLRLFPAVACGWPSPAADYEEAPLSLDELVGVSACSTFLVRAKGDSMVGAGIYDQDVLVVDRRLSAPLGSIVVAVFNGEFTVKRIGKVGNQAALLPENDAYKPILIAEGEEVQTWGVVTWNLHRLR